MIPVPRFSGMGLLFPFLAMAMALGRTDSQADTETWRPRWERDLVPTGGETAVSTAAVSPSTTPSAEPDTMRSTTPSGTPQHAPLGRFLLDAAILADTRDDFADLRLLDGREKPIGIQVRPVGGLEIHCVETAVPMRRVSMRVLGDSAFEAVYMAEDPARLPDRISVAVEDRDFEISLSLWTAGAASEADLDDLEKTAWTQRLRNVPLFDYSRFVDLRREEARWSAHRDRAVRLRVNGLTQTQRSLVSTLSGQVGRPQDETFQVEKRLLRVDAISFGGRVCESRKAGTLADTVVLASPGFARPLSEPGAKRSWFVFPAGRLPLKSLTFRTGTPNFMRSAILTGWPDSVIAPSDTAAQPWKWPRVAEARLHRIDWAGPSNEVDSNLGVRFFPPRRFATLALGVLDNDDPALILLGAAAEAERLEALFPVQGAGTYRLSYGDRAAGALHFDFERMLERVPASAAALWSPGPPRPSARKGPEAGSSRFPRLTWLTGELLLTAGLALAIAGLMVLVFLVARKAGAAGSAGSTESTESTESGKDR